MVFRLPSGAFFPAQALTSRLWVWLAGGVLAVAIAGEGWDLWSTLSQPRAPAAPTVVQPAEAADPDYAARIGQYHLLGKPLAGAPPPETKRTSLNLTLIGTLAGTEPQLAIIDGPSGQRAYAVGEEVVGGVSVKAIEPRRVLLDNQGSPEALEMAAAASVAKMALGRSAVAEDATETTVALAGAEAAGLFLAGRQGRGIRTAEVRRNGVLKGYRLLAAPENLMTRLGLEPMDIVTHINDQPVAELAGQAGFPASLLEADVVVLRVDRGGRPRRVRVRIDD